MVLNFIGRLFILGNCSATLLLAGLFPMMGLQALAEVPRVKDLQRPATTMKEWRAQVEAATVQVTSVKVEHTDTGLEITLGTAEGKPLQVDATKFRTEGNSLIADIPNAVLALPDQRGFSAENPTADIATVQVVQQAVSNIRISVTGKDALPKTEVTLRTGEFAYSLNPEAEEPDEEIVVTGEGQRGYRVPDTSVGTRTDAPLRDIPQSIQVVPQQVLQDQQITRLEDALRNVSGVVPAFSGLAGAISSFTIRGFSVGEGNFLRNGLRDSQGSSALELPNIERVEVLRGPASVLYGYGTPGGTINLVTKQPLRDPFYAVDATIGSYGFYRGAIDLSGPLNDSKTVLYRLNASYRSSGSFIDFVDSDNLSIAPVLSVAVGERTSLTVEGEYVSTTNGWFSGLPAIGTVLPNSNGEISRSRNFGESSDSIEQTIGRIGYRLEHQFSNNWSFRNAFRATLQRYSDNITIPTRLRPDNRNLNRVYRQYVFGNFDEYTLTTDLIGRFSTGSIKHQLLIGVDLGRYIDKSLVTLGTASPIDLFNPVYGQPLNSPLTPISDRNNIRDSLGFFVQDQVTLTENLKLLLGLRFDAFEQRNSNLLIDAQVNQSGDAFSPRVGIVYQPIQPISLYASYSRSFNPQLGTAFNGSIFQPERGTQYEIGVKADLSKRLSATLAFFDLTLSNVLTDDPDNPGFSIQTGEQYSRGIEFNIAGEILPGWSILAGYAYTNAKITRDNFYPVDNRLNNVPENAFNLWTSYEVQRGSWRGFGVGVGLFFVGERQGDLDNSFQIPSYLRTDIAIFYKHDRFRVGLNIRNLFDVTYFESALNNVRVSSGAPFTVQGTISWEF